MMNEANEPETLDVPLYFGCNHNRLNNLLEMMAEDTLFAKDQYTKAQNQAILYTSIRAWVVENKGKRFNLRFNYVDRADREYREDHLDGCVVAGINTTSWNLMVRVPAVMRSGLRYTMSLSGHFYLSGDICVSFDGLAKSIAIEHLYFWDACHDKAEKLVWLEDLGG